MRAAHSDSDRLGKKLTQAQCGCATGKNMDQMFDRLGNLLKSFLQDEKDSFSDSKKASISDPDLQEAWEELDDFMRTGKSSESGPSKERAGAAMPTPIPQSLRKDYQTLNVSFGSPLDEVAKSYKTLLRKHHPDRHATNPAALAKATEITKQLTSSYSRIRQYVETGKIS